MQFPEKAAELWAYQTSILHTVHAYEDSTWVAYDRLYRQEMLAKKDLNWFVRLYSEALTGRAKRHPQCPHCLSEDHMGPTTLTHRSWDGSRAPPHCKGARPRARKLPPPLRRNPGRSTATSICRFTRCCFLHVCSECSGPHSAVHCPQSQAGPASRGANPWSRPLDPARSSRLHPYSPAPALGSDQQ